jgi:hypothetical protein
MSYHVGQRVSVVVNNVREDGVVERLYDDPADDVVWVKLDSDPLPGPTSLFGPDEEWGELRVLEPDYAI